MICDLIDLPWRARAYWHFLTTIYDLGEWPDWYLEQAATYAREHQVKPGCRADLACRELARRKALDS